MLICIVHLDCVLGICFTFKFGGLHNEVEKFGGKEVLPPNTLLLWDAVCPKTSSRELPVVTTKEKVGPAVRENCHRATAIRWSCRKLAVITAS